MNTSIEYIYRKKDLIKIAFLMLLIAGALLLLNAAHKNDLVSEGFIADFLKNSGKWAPILFIAIHALSICLFFPASFMILLGAVVFGTYWGFLYSWAGCLLGGSVVFFMGRIMGRDFVVAHIKGRFEKFDDYIMETGFATVIYLRLLNIPFTPMSYAISLTKIRFVDYLLGTGLGILTGMFVICFLSGTIKQLLVSKDLSILLTPGIFFAGILFFISLFAPLIVKKARGRN